MTAMWKWVLGIVGAIAAAALAVFGSGGRRRATKIMLSAARPHYKITALPLKKSAPPALAAAQTALSRARRRPGAEVLSNDDHVDRINRAGRNCRD